MQLRISFLWPLSGRLLPVLMIHWARCLLLASLGMAVSTLLWAGAVTDPNVFPPGTTNPLAGIMDWNRAATYLQTNELGEVSGVTNTAFGPGLPVWDRSRKTEPLKPRIRIEADGAVAEGGAHQARFEKI
jgi:hypothetical protein